MFGKLQAIKENKKSIIISLICGIVIFYAQPLLTFIGIQVVNLFSLFSNRFSSYFYQLVAVNDPNRISDYVASLTVILLFLVSFDFFYKPYELIKEAESKLVEFERSKDSGRDSKEEEADIESELAKLKTWIKKRKVHAIWIIICGGFIFFLFSYKQGLNSQVNYINVSFQNKLTILSVHLSDREIKQLRAKWVQMKTVDEYRQIMNTIDDYDKKYNITESP